MRKCFWQRWHDKKGRRKRLEQLGIRGQELKIASSGRGAWRVAKLNAAAIVPCVLTTVPILSPGISSLVSTNAMLFIINLVRSSEVDV